MTDIRKGMLHFLREEVLDGENSYKCDRCHKNVRATKKYSILAAPNVLVVNLKRFDFTYAGKLSHFVTYPETLSLKTFISEAEDMETSNENSLRNVTYKLYGVLVHLGYTSHSGHYYSYVRGPNDIWYKADDTQVTTVRTQDALNQNAYILFYNRVPTSPTTNSITPTKQSVCFPLPPPLFSINLGRPQTSSITSSSLKQQQICQETNSLKNIPENKFKSTFKTVEAEQNSNKTLDYDQVLKIKSLNKRKLKLINRKKKLKDLKLKKKTMDSINEHDLKKLKKQIHKTKKLIRQEKSKIKKLKKYESCSSDQSDDDSESSSSKRKTTESYKEPHKRSKTTNSLSLLKQYSSSESSDEVLSSRSSPSSRSSSRSNSSDVSANSQKQSSTPTQGSVLKENSTYVGNNLNKTSHFNESLSNKGNVSNDENHRPNRSYEDDHSLSNNYTNVS